MIRLWLFVSLIVALSAFSFKNVLLPTPKTYSSTTPAFSFEYAGNAVLNTEGENPRIDFPLLEKGTNLQEKYLEIIVKQGNSNCPDSNNYAQGTIPKNLIINGISFQKWEGSDAGAGNIYETEEYVTQKGGFCISFRFVFHSTQPQNYDNPPSVFQRRKESIVIKEVLSSMKM
jgi:hypothetical protein